MRHIEQAGLIAMIGTSDQDVVYPKLVKILLWMVSGHTV